MILNSPKLNTEIHHCKTKIEQTSKNRREISFTKTKALVFVNCLLVMLLLICYV